MPHKAPGKVHCKGISVIELGEMFPDEDSARTWFESHIWPEGRCCPRCGSVRTHEAKHAKSPYRCTDCRAYFSVKTGTALEGSKVSLRKWVFAFYLETTSLKGVSSMKLHRDIKVTQKTAWFMLHRIREVWATNKAACFTGPTEADETYIGGKRKNMSNAQRKELAEQGAGRGRRWQDRGRRTQGPRHEAGTGQGRRAHRQADAPGARRRAHGAGSHRVGDSGSSVESYEGVTELSFEVCSRRGPSTPPDSGVVP